MLVVVDLGTVLADPERIRALLALLFPADQPQPRIRLKTHQERAAYNAGWDAGHRTRKPAQCKGG